MSESPSAATARAGAQPRAVPTELRAVLLGGFIGLALVAAGPFVLDTYTVNILIRSLLYAAVALTVDILWGYTGILTFGHSAFFGIGAYACALVFTHLDFGPGYALLALALAIGAAVAVAALTGWLAFYHGASPLYGSIITLVLPIVLTQLVFSGGTFTGSSSGLSGFYTFDWSIEAWFWIAGTGLVLLTCAAWLFVNSDAGRVLVAIRENEQRCAYLGIDISRVKILLLMVTAAIAAVAGYGYAAFTDVVAPELTGFLLGTELLIWVALGGRGTLIGPVLGTILIDLTSAYLSGNLPFVWRLIVGTAFVAVIIALPQGFLPALLGLWRRFLPGGARRLAAPALAVVPERPAPHVEHGAAALEVKGVHRHFGSLRVLQGIDFAAREGELLSLVGPNGAGKTTLMRCLADGLERSGGTVRILGHDIGRQPPHRIVAYGIGRKFQTATVFGTLTVAECLRIARFRLERPSLVRPSPTLPLPESAARIVEETGLAGALAVEARHLSHGQKQALELAMVLALEPRVLLLDEPTAGLTRAERQRIGAILRDLIAREQLCILLVEHDLDFVREISSRVIVLHQGRLVLDGTVAEVVEAELVRTIYAGSSRHALEAGGAA